jgi:hypothetical protein
MKTACMRDFASTQWVRQNCRFAKAEKQPLTTKEREQVNRRFPSKECSFAKDKDGYYCYTHRARSESYKSISQIPASAVEFIGSTG